MSGILRKGQFQFDIVDNLIDEFQPFCESTCFWIFLISAEAISATEGLGYRIFLVRRYLSMDVILPYVVWITLLAFLFDYVLKQFNYRTFKWYDAGKER